jgi:hypothetical protein
MSSSETTGASPETGRRSPKRRLLVMAVLGVCLLGAAAWTVAWQLLAIRVEATLDAWIAQRRALGDRIEHGPMTTSGFPLAVDVQIRQVHWSREDGPTLLTAAAPEVIASTPVWNPLRLTLRPTKGGRASAAGSWGSVTGDAEIAHAMLALGRRAPTRIDLTLRKLDLTGPGGVMHATVDEVTAVIDTEPEPDENEVAGSVPTVLTISLYADGVRPSGVDHLPFDGPAKIALNAVLRGPMDPTAGVPGLATWRDAGGVIDINRLAVSWSPVDLVGDGTVALDSALRPEGAGIAEIQGAAETLDRLVAQGRMKAGQAALFKLAVIAASEPSDDGSGQRLKAPVTVQGGVVRVGQIAVGKVRPITE